MLSQICNQCITDNIGSPCRLPGLYFAAVGKPIERIANRGLDVRFDTDEVAPNTRIRPAAARAAVLSRLESSCQAG
jgi:hypothetical protein